MSKKIDIIKNGIINENPTFVQLLGMCPTLAVTTSGKNGMAMGLAVTAVLMCSNAVISALRKVIPDKIRIPAFIVIIASFVTVIDMMMHAFSYDLYQQLGLFIPLIVVNCVILGRAEAFASKNPVGDSICDGFGMGVGFTIALTVLGCVREILGAGSIFGLVLFGESFQPALMMIMPPGAFIALGCLIAMVNHRNNKKNA